MPDNPATLASAARAAFSAARTRPGSSVFTRLGSSIHRIVLFSREFRILHIADREEFPLGAASGTNGSRLFPYYRKRVFGVLIGLAQRTPPTAFYGQFVDPERGEVSPEFDSDSSLLGFNTVLLPIMSGDRVRLWYGIILFPHAYAERIRETLWVNLGWSLFLLFFSLLFFLFRPKTRPLSEEAMRAFTEKHGLTQREQEISALVVRGTDYRTIADTLCISLKTVKAHVYNIYQKAGVGNRLEMFERIRKSL